MTVLQPWWLVFALLLFIAFWLLRTSQTDAWQQVIPQNVLVFLKRHKKSTPKRNIVWLIAAIGFAALSGPSTESEDKESYRHTQGWIVLADVSRSMTLTDITPSRIAAMRDAALELASQAQAHSVTLIVYAGDAFLIAPPSYDIENFNANANQLSYGIIPLDGSNLTRALSLGLSVIEDSGLVNARLFVLSDTGGFNTRSSSAIARIADRGHRTDLILFGTEEFSSEETGNNEQIDLQLAKNMANVGNGTVIRADAIGNVNYSKLDLDDNVPATELLTQSGLITLGWSNHSHWLLLCAVPFMLMLFYRQLKQ